MDTITSTEDFDINMESKEIEYDEGELYEYLEPNFGL